MTVTLKAIKEAIDHDYPVLVVINGEYYDLSLDDSEPETENSSDIF